MAFLFEKLLIWLVFYRLSNQLTVLIKNAKKCKNHQHDSFLKFCFLCKWHFFEFQLMFQWQRFLFQVRFYLKCCCLNLWSDAEVHVLRLLLCTQQGTGLLAKVSFNYFAIFIKQRSSSTATESSWGAERKSGAYFEFMNSWPWVQNRD